MLASKEKRLVQTIFHVITKNDVKDAAGDGDGAFTFARSLAGQTIEAIRAVGEGDLDVNPEAVGVFVAERCNRFMSQTAITAVIAEAIGENVGILAQARIDLLYDGLGLVEEVEDETPEPPPGLRANKAVAVKKAPTKKPAKG